MRHNLDLYNDFQIDKLIRKGAEKLEVNSNVISTAIAGLTDELERYRLYELQNTDQDSKERKFLTEVEIKASIDFLNQPDLLQSTNEMIGKSGVIGEENNRLVMYLIFTSRKREQPLHAISLGSSGTRKSHLQEKVGELIP